MPEGYQGDRVGDATHGTPGGSDAECQEVQEAISVSPFRWSADRLPAAIAMRRERM
jgi:hypothetical protein